jgi:hypothetical protein
MAAAAIGLMKRYKLSSACLDTIRRSSLSLDAIACQARLPRGLLQKCEPRLTAEQHRAFWDAVGHVSADPAIGLRLGADTRAERLCFVTMAALAARSLRDALGHAVRYGQLVCCGELQVRTDALEDTVRCQWVWSGPASTVMDDRALAWLATVADRGTAGAIRPAGVEASDPRRTQLYRQHFACPVSASTSGNALIYRGSDLDRPFATSDNEMLRLLLKGLDASLRACEPGDARRLTSRPPPVSAFASTPAA